MGGMKEVGVSVGDGDDGPTYGIREMLLNRPKSSHNE